jgi:hypothetical protein
VVAHEQDEIVPVETTDAYTKAFGADSFVAEGFAHAVDKNNPSPTELRAYHERIADWLNKH